MVGRGLPKEHFCKKKCQNIFSEVAINVNLHFSHFKSVATINCHSNQGSYPIETKKNTNIRSPGIWMIYVKFGKNRLHGFRGDVV